MLARVGRIKAIRNRVGRIKGYIHSYKGENKDIQRR